MKLTPMFLFVCLVGLFLSCGNNTSPTLSKIVLYYVGWNSDSFKTFSCVELISSNNFIQITDEEDVDKLLSAFENMKRITAEGQEQVDARLCCLFFSKNEAIIKSISFGNFNEMQIDDIVYQTDDSFFRLVLSFLPSDYLDS